jgi:histidine ammonia-lyase
MPESVNTHSEPVYLGMGDLRIEQVVGVARYGWTVVEIEERTEQSGSLTVYERIMLSRKWVEKVLRENNQLVADGEDPRAYYGINTGFGFKAGQNGLSDEDVPWVIRNLIVSHSVGVGKALSPEIVRAAMLIRANSLAQGYSGVRPILINTLIRMLNRGVIPYIPEHGSVGASGDLIPLSHLAAVMSVSPHGRPSVETSAADYNESGMAYLDLDKFPGDAQFEDPITFDGYRLALMSGHQAMRAAGLEPLSLEAKEGLALNNGATFSAAIAALALHDAENLVRHSEIGTALSMEALLGFRDAFLPHIQRVRHHRGQVEVARRVLKITRGSDLLDGDVDLDPGCEPPQDPYALRVVPQVLGGIWDTLAFIRRTVSDEINAATDNPLIFNLPEDHPNYLPRPYRAVSGGNFHGAPLAYSMDFLAIIITDLGSLSERMIFRLMDPGLSLGLPACLVEDEISKPGLTSGVMLAQYLAASLVSDCKTLAHPDSVDSIPTSANQEDHVSMSMNAARHARQVVENINHVVAIELLCGYLALKWRVANLERNLGDQPSPSLSPSRQDERLASLYRRLRARSADTHLSLGPGSTAALEAITDLLYGENQPLPRLGDKPAARDRYLQPYLLRLVKLLRSGVLVEEVYNAADIQHLSE